ncbi:MAG: HAMP domain-containing sensor histidine kinase [Bacteroidales bacterium]
MEKRKSYLPLIIFTFIFLILLVFTQISQLIETAETEKRHFAQSVKLSLNLVAEQMSHDRLMCKNVQYCLLDTQMVNTQELRRTEWHKVDSIIRINLDQYDINLAYDFEIINKQLNLPQGIGDTCEVCYSESLEIALQQAGIELMVKFPEMNKFIIKRISPLFISSIALILLVSVSFVITLSLYLKEKILAARIREFINNMVHEFKTPLASIGFANNRIQSSKELVMTEKLLKYSGIIEAEKRKMEENIGHILDLAQLESGHHVLEFENLSLPEIIKECIEAMHPNVEQNQGEIVFKNYNDFPKISGSRVHLVNAFCNLIDNSCKYSDKILKINIVIRQEMSWLIVEFTDNGMGIAKKYQKYIFDKFYRVPTGNVHNIKGFGIGLSYVKEIVKLHHGKIELESTEGKGTTFRIYLPSIARE